MKGIRHLAVAAVLGLGLVSAAQAHVFVGVGVGLPAMSAMPVMTPVAPIAAVPVYAPPPAVYYAPPPPVYVPPPVVVGYWGHPRWGYRGYYAY